jgi:nucleotide-binding universal stress UspA family protein
LKTIRKILVPLDGSKHSQRALELAIAISSDKNTTITGLHVIRFPIISKSKIKDQYRKIAVKIIGHATKMAKKDGVSFNGKIGSNGYVGKQIVRAAQDGKFDVIVMGSRGPNPIAEMFLGSVANYVLNKSKIPVLIVK